jgi:hypothetical protein
MDIAFVTPKEVAEEIKTNINPKKSPRYDLITGEILKNLLKKVIIKLTHLINAAFGLKHVPDAWKMGKVLMIPKQGKPLNEVTSYRPISLLPIISKLFEKLLLKRLKPLIESKNLIPSHQFGFRDKHATTDPMHRITNIIERAYEENKIGSAIFLDIAQAFDKVWHVGLMNKLKNTPPRQLTQILQTYITGRMFRVKQKEAYSTIKEIKAGVPQGSVFALILYLLYTWDIPQEEDITTATFADDTAIHAVGYSSEETTTKLQEACFRINDWTKLWRMRISENKSVHIDFAYRKNVQILVSINNTNITYSNTAKYLGMNLDIRLRWKEHIKKKRRELDLKYKKNLLATCEEISAFCAK